MPGKAMPTKGRNKNILVVYYRLTIWSPVCLISCQRNVGSIVSLHVLTNDFEFSNVCGCECCGERPSFFFFE